MHMRRLSFIYLCAVCGSAALSASVAHAAPQLAPLPRRSGEKTRGGEKRHASGDVLGGIEARDSNHSKPAVLDLLELEFRARRLV
jgi:hypothetical protein